jgi:hypothetical protein
LVTPEEAPVSELVQSFGLEHVVCRKPGLSAAVNAAWRLGTEEFVTWLGDDDLLSPGSLEVTESTLRANPGKGFVYGRARYIDGDGSTLFVSRPTRYAASYLRYGKNFVPQPGSLVNRDCAVRAGMLDETLHNAMDQDLFTRLHLMHGSVYVAKELAAFRLHDSNISVIKGGTDEGTSIRDRYVGSTIGLLTNKAINASLSRAFYASQRRLPSRPPAVRSDGLCYTSPVGHVLEPS